MSKQDPPKESEPQRRKSNKRAKEAAAGAAVLGAAAAVTASDLMEDRSEQLGADPASFDAAAAPFTQGSAAVPAGSGGGSNTGASAPSPGTGRARDGTAATPGTAKGSGGSSAGAGPAQDPGGEGLQSVGSEAQGVAGEEEEEYSGTGTENPLDELFPGEPTEDAHQDLVEALPEGTGDDVIRAVTLGIGPAAVIEVAGATGVLDDTQDRVNEQIDEFIHSDGVQEFGSDVGDAMFSAGDAISFPARVLAGEEHAPEFVGKAQDDVEEALSDGGDLLKGLDPSHTPPVEAVSEAYWQATWDVQQEATRGITQIDEGAISDELGRAADSVGDLADQAGDAAHDAGEAVGDAAEEAGDAAQDAGEDIVDAGEDVVEDVNPFD
jgi:hypothetical protein